MKKNVKMIAFAIVVCAVSALNVKVMLNSEHAEDMATTTLAAIGEGTPGESGEGSEGGSGESGGSGQESNNNGSGLYHYEHLQGRPKACTLYTYTKGGVSATYDSEQSSLGGEYQKTTTSGIVETCPNTGNGCTVYSCRQTTN